MDAARRHGPTGRCGLVRRSLSRGAQEATGLETGTAKRAGRSIGDRSCGAGVGELRKTGTKGPRRRGTKETGRKRRGEGRKCCAIRSVIEFCGSRRVCLQPPRRRAQCAGAIGSTPRAVRGLRLKWRPSSRATGNGPTNYRIAEGRFDAENATVAELIQLAYNVESDDQLQKGPDWTNSERFDMRPKPRMRTG